MAVPFGDEDLNGDLFFDLGDGEKLERTPETQIFVPQGFIPQCQMGEKLEMTQAQFEDAMIGNLMLVHAFDGALPLQVKCEAAYLRVLVIRAGLVNPNWNPGELHIKEVEARHGNVTGQVENDANALLGGDPRDANIWNVHITEQRRSFLRKNFAVLVSMVALHFRQRAHHYLEESGEYYNKLWQKCLLSEADRPVNWRVISRVALHAIPPLVLDDALLYYVDHNRVPGAIVKRAYCAPAGAAVYPALLRGWEDVSGVFQQFRRGREDLEDDLKIIVARVISRDRKARWERSLNANLYGVARVRDHEEHYSALSALVKGVYGAYAADAPLNDSQALQRVSGNAPVLCGVAGAAAKTLFDKNIPLLLPDA